MPLMLNFVGNFVSAHLFNGINYVAAAHRTASGASVLCHKFRLDVLGKYCRPVQPLLSGGQYRSPDFYMSGMILRDINFQVNVKTPGTNRSLIKIIYAVSGCRQKNFPWL